MTHQNVKWGELDKYIEKSKSVVEDFKRLEDINAEKKKLHDSESKLVDEENSIRSKYKQDYTSKLNDRLDDFGILTIVTGNDSNEGRIISVTEDEMKIRCSYNYGQSSREYVISTKELKENGYVIVEAPWGSGKAFVVDRINDPAKVFKIIKYRLSLEVGKLMNDASYYSNNAEEYKKKAEDCKSQLKAYKKVTDGKITRIFNDISFGVTDLKIEDILKTLPREVCMYEEEKNDSDK